MKTFRLFSMAALALVMAACSSEDNALENAAPAKPGLIPFSATVAPLSGATTRTEYTEVTSGDDAGKINVAWKEGDQIFIARLTPDLGTAGRVTVGEPNDDGSAPLSGNISGADGNEIEAYYPASAYDDWLTFSEKYNAQDGTLRGIQDNLDYRKGTGEISVIGDKATLADKLQMKSQIAIWKLTLQNTLGANLNATKVTIKDGSEIKAATKDISAKSEVYMAVPLDASPTTFNNLTIEATTADGTYTYAAPSAVNLSQSTYYQSTLTMAKIISLSGRYPGDDELVIADGCILTDFAVGQSCKVSIADGATVTLRDVQNSGKIDDHGTILECRPGIKCLGDATIILEGNNTVTGGDQYAGIYVPGDKTLTIRGTGSLNVTGGYSAAGIGGNATGDASCGSIVISGGTVTATGGSGGAGIGLGANGGECKDITISGGTVTATGGSGGAGIGLGVSWGGCKAITISGGTVTATGSDGAPGIGGVEGVYESITITGDVTKVTATKGQGAQYSIGIEDDYSWEDCGPITIGGTVYFEEGNFKDDALTTSPFVYQP